MKKKINFVDNNKIAKAIEFAFNAHNNQFRKGTPEPYIVHPLRVFYSLVQLGINDTDMLCASILHDTIEDCDVTYQDLESKFGEKVADLVQTLTDDKSLPRYERKKKSRNKIKDASPKAKLIKAADRLDNLKGEFPDFWTTEKKLQYLKESKLLIEALVKNIYDDVYCIFVRQLTDEIAQTINKLEQNIIERNQVNDDPRDI